MLVLKLLLKLLLLLCDLSLQLCQQLEFVLLVSCSHSLNPQDCVQASWHAAEHTRVANLLLLRDVHATCTGAGAKHHIAHAVRYACALQSNHWLGLGLRLLLQGQIARQGCTLNRGAEAAWAARRVRLVAMVVCVLICCQVRR
jgi:hypothetical protein